VKQLWASVTSKTIAMSRGVKVVIGEQLAEGGFSFVYHASVGKNKFALKKILCQTSEQVVPDNTMLYTRKV
jgi:hypothetical protein